MRRSALLEGLEPRTLLAVTLVKDVNPGTTILPQPTDLVELDSTVFFNAGQKPWRSDGTPEGTFLFWDIYGSSELTPIGNSLYLVHEGWLNKSDGTMAGSERIAPVSNARDFFDLNGRAFFRAADGGGDELWTSDGTAAGTHRVRDIRPGAAGSVPRGFTNVNGRLFFRADDGVNGLELWTSDGTEAGTFMVRDIAPGAASSGPTSLVNVGGTLYFAASDGSSGFELWKSDGTEAGTMRVVDLRPGAGGSTPVMLTNVNGTLMFVANDGASGFEIWKSDGTAAGTTLVRDLIPGAGGALIDNLAAVGSTLYFVADDGVSGAELWKTDGSSAGTVRVKDIAPGAAGSQPHSLAAFGNQLFFAAYGGATGHEPWVSDGTEAGTFLLRDVAAGPPRSNVTYVTPTSDGSSVFFIADNYDGPALWTTDGTVAGTRFVERPTAEFVVGSGIRNAITVGGTTYFSADDGTHGRELWKSDGTTAGTVMVTEIVPGRAWDSFDHFTDLNGTLLFVYKSQWYRSDGTAAGTFKISDATVHVPIAPKIVGDTLYFAASGTGGRGLWKSDGTAAGTSFVRSFGSSQHWYPQSLTDVGGTLMFAANDGAAGHELWKSDGSTAGTVMVRDILPGAASSGPELLTAAGSRLFFRADGGNGAGYELWTSDGTTVGTAMVEDIRPGADSSRIWSMAAVGSTLFFSADDGTNGHELWTSNGTAAGTALLKEINPGSGGASIGSMSAAHGLLWFRASNAVAGDELWKSDGTAAGTVMVKDANPGAGGSGPAKITALPDGRVLYAGNTWQPWISDGTSAGTFLFYPYSVETSAVLGNQLLFASYSAWESEWLALDLATAAPLSAGAATASAPAGAAAAMTASPMSGPSATALETGADRFYNGVIGDPFDASSFGYQEINVTYHNSGYVSPFDSDVPDETRLRLLAEQAANTGKPLAINIEHMAIDLRYYPEGTVALGVEKFAAILDWMHDQRPDLEVGHVGSFPNGMWPAPTPGGAVEGAWKAANDRLRPVTDRMDLMFSGIYQLSGKVKDWVDFAHAQMAEAGRYGKPLYPFIWAVYDGSFDASVWRRPVSAEFWRIELDVVRDLADGAVVWGEQFDEDMPWYTVMRDFTMHPDPIVPPAPVGLVASASLADARISLGWKDSAFTETGYRIERRAAGDADFTAIATLARDATAYADTTAATNIDYTYRVIAVNAAGDSMASNEAAAKIQAAPAAPTNVNAAAQSSRRVRITWTPPPASHEVQTFAIERSGVVVATTAGDADSFEDAGLAPGTSYTYRIRATNAAGDSPWSAPAPVTTPLGDAALRGRWRFDETSGTVAADSGPAARHGTLVSGPAWSGGTLGGALAFDGVDDRVTIPDHADLRFAATDSYTLAAWFNLAALPNKAVAVISKSGGALTGGYGIGIDAANRWRFSGATPLTGTAAATGWTHVAAVQDGAAGTRSLYVNGVLVASGAAHAADAAGALWIGGAEGGGAFFSGRADDVRLYGRALAPADVAAHAAPRVTLAGGDGDEQWSVQLDPAGEVYQFFVNTPASGTPTFTRPHDAVASIAVTGGDGADRLILDFAAGAPLPDYGFTFDGGAGSGDQLVLRGGGGIADSFALTAAQVTRNGASADYVNIEAIELSDGIYHFTGDADGRALRIGDGATVAFDVPQRLAALQVDAGGLLDLRDNNFALDYGSVSPIGNWTGSAYDGITGWIAAGRIVSTLASDRLTTLGVAEARHALNLQAGQTGTWSGRAVDSTAVLVRFTYAGDANVDGRINIDDYGRIDSMIGQSGSVWGWFNGDFNYDGKLNIDDYGIIDSNVARQGGPL